MQHNTKAKEFWIHQLKHTFRSFYDDLFSHLHAKLQLADSIILSEHNLRKYLNKMTAIPGFCFSCVCSVTVVRKLNCPLFVLSGLPGFDDFDIDCFTNFKEKNKRSKQTEPLPETTENDMKGQVPLGNFCMVTCTFFVYNPPPPHPSYPAAHDSSQPPNQPIPREGQEIHYVMSFLVLTFVTELPPFFSVTHNSSVAVGMVVSTQPVESDPRTALHRNNGYAMCLHFIST